MEEVLCQDPKHKEQSICPIRDDVVRKYGVSVMTAFTDNPHYTYRVFESVAVNEVGYCSGVVCVDVTFASGSADRTGLLSGYKLVHIFVEENF